MSKKSKFQFLTRFYSYDEPVMRTEKISMCHESHGCYRYYYHGKDGMIRQLSSVRCGIDYAIYHLQYLNRKIKIKSFRKSHRLDQFDRSGWMKC